MPLRSVASVTVAFGMVSIPVKIYTATSSVGISFNMLHKGCGSRLKQQYVCEKEGVVVDKEATDKGYEFAKNQYVTFEKEEIDALAEEATKCVEIAEFIPADSIDPIYYDKAYFLAPDKGGNKAYALLLEAMKKSGKTAVGRYAARGKQYIVQLRPVPGGIVMQQLLYKPEVRSIDDVGIQPTTVNDAEISLAMQLVSAISSDTFDASKYVDGVAKRIEEAVAAKINGEAVITAAPVATTGKVIDVMDALKASLAAMQKPAAAPKAEKPVAKKKKTVAA